MKFRKFVMIGAASLSMLAGIPGAALAGDAGRAKRDLMVAKDNAESGRWDDFDTNMKKANTDMDGLSDAEKSPLLAEIKSIKEIVTKSVEEDVTKRLDKAATAAPGMGKLDIDRSKMRLDSDEAKDYADPAVIEKLRARIASMSGAPAPAPTAPAPNTPAPKIPGAPKTTPPATPAPAPKSPEPAAPKGSTPTPVPATAARAPSSPDFDTAKSRARSAHNIFDQASGPKDFDMADSFRRQALKLLETVPDAEKASLMADLTKLGQAIDAADLKAQRAEEFRRVDERLHRYVGDAENSIQNGIVCDSDRIDKAAQLAASEDVKTYMDADHIKQYQTQIDALRVKLKAHNQATALERSADTLKELEAKVAADPLKGVDEASAYKVFNELKTLSDRVLGEFARVPHDDPEIKAVLDRVASANAKMDASAGKWATQKMQEKFAQSWKFASQDFAGWESEKASAQATAMRRVEGLDKTARAVSGTVYWLNSSDTKETLSKYRDNPVVASIGQGARKMLDDSSAKLNAAFVATIAAAETAPMPKRPSDRAQMGYLAHDAEQWLAGTKYKDPTVARAQALDTKWKTEVARVEKERAEALEKLTAAADAAWPKIEGSISAEKGFDPGEAERWKGKTVLIKGYYNRTGWDFDSMYDYAVDIKGHPVAGNYEPNVRTAFNEGSSHTEFGIDDHTGWDLIAVVVGPGKINRRVTTEWKDANSHQLLMKTESLVAEPCVLIKIIGLHAGPVAVGPK